MCQSARFVIKGRAAGQVEEVLLQETGKTTSHSCNTCHSHACSRCVLNEWCHIAAVSFYTASAVTKVTAACVQGAPFARRSFVTGAGWRKTETHKHIAAMSLYTAHTFFHKCDSSMCAGAPLCEKELCNGCWLAQDRVGQAHSRNVPSQCNVSTKVTASNRYIPLTPNLIHCLILFDLSCHTC